MLPTRLRQAIKKVPVLKLRQSRDFTLGKPIFSHFFTRPNGASYIEYGFMFDSSHILRAQSFNKTVKPLLLSLHNFLR